MSADPSPAAPEPSTDARPGESAGAAGPTVPNPRPAPSIETADAAQPAGPAAGLTERERAILAFEQQWWRHAGAKEQAVRDTFGISSTRYYQLLNGLLDNPAALAADPVLISRLRRLRSSRARNRRR
ncbi:DUF3263 domain-containing protein [Micromonospora sp. NPDC050795]|uniref:DUF3263 domain-containing protein n=1 Tax=Micromonospora sp. NPDC050795 TaxID=3364282 RepID=UPI0037AA55D0